MDASVSTVRPDALTAAEPVLRLRGLTKRFGALTAVDRLDLDVFSGEVFGLLGPNGSGKSTTLNMILGFIRPTMGTVTVDGHELASERLAALASVGGLVEGSAFYPYLTGRLNLRMLARLRRLPPARVDEVLALVGLERAADRQFGGYSQGMRQRLGVAAALMHDPRLVVLDEPTSGLDPAGTREMRALIPAIAAQGHTVVLASHLLNEVEQVCDRVGIMKDGRIIALGAVSALLRRDGTLRVRVRADRALEAQRVLEAMDGVRRVSPSDGALVVEARIGGEAVNRALAGAGIYASEIERADRTLESVFIQLTETEGRA